MKPFTVRKAYVIVVKTLRSLVRLPAIPLTVNDLVQVIHTRVSVIKQYNLVPATRDRRHMAGKVIVGLALHWPCVTDLSAVYLPTNSRPGRRMGHDRSNPSIHCSMRYSRLCALNRIVVTQLQAPE